MMDDKIKKEYDILWFILYHAAGIRFSIEKSNDLSIVATHENVILTKAYKVLLGSISTAALDELIRYIKDEFLVDLITEGVEDYDFEEKPTSMLFKLKAIFQFFFDIEEAEGGRAQDDKFVIVDIFYTTPIRLFYNIFQNNQKLVDFFELLQNVITVDRMQTYIMSYKNTVKFKNKELLELYRKLLILDSNHNAIMANMKVINISRRDRANTIYKSRMENLERYIDKLDHNDPFFNMSYIMQANILYEVDFYFCKQNNILNTHKNTLEEIKMADQKGKRGKLNLGRHGFGRDILRYLKKGYLK